MKKREKPPEVEAFERAFDSNAPGAANPGAGLNGGSGWPAPGQSAIRRAPGTSPGLRAQGPLGSPLAARTPSQSFTAATAQRTPPPSAALGASSTGQPVGRLWSLEDEEDDYDDEVEAKRRGGFQTSGRRPVPPAPPDRFSAVLVRLVLMLVALYAAYSLQSHSQRNYSIGSVNDKSKTVTISSVSYDAGWPLKYAHVELQQVPVAAADPTPGLHDIQSGALLVDVLMVGVPFWLLLEAVWLFWSVILRNFGPKRPVRRFFAVGFTMLPGALWLIGGLALGGFLSVTTSLNHGTLSDWPKYAWPAVAPAVPGFGMASAVSSLLSIPPSLWQADFGIFLLVMALPILLLTGCLYIFFCLIGRGLRQLGEGIPG